MVVCHLLDPLVHLLPYNAGYQLYSNREHVRINVPLINDADIEASARKGIGAHKARRPRTENQNVDVLATMRAGAHGRTFCKVEGDGRDNDGTCSLYPVCED